MRAIERSETMIIVRVGRDIVDGLLGAGAWWLVVSGRRVEIIQPTTNHQPPATVLEIQLQPELHLARRLGAGDASEGRAGDATVRTAQDHAVEDVEDLPPEIEAETLSEVEALLQRDVFPQVGLKARLPVIARRVAQGIGLRNDDAAGVAEDCDRTDWNEVAGVARRRPVVRIVGGVDNPTVQRLD